MKFATGDDRKASGIDLDRALAGLEGEWERFLLERVAIVQAMKAVEAAKDSLDGAMDAFNAIRNFPSFPEISLIRVKTSMSASYDLYTDAVVCLVSANEFYKSACRIFRSDPNHAKIFGETGDIPPDLAAAVDDAFRSASDAEKAASDSVDASGEAKISILEALPTERC
jgi:hypothetical protein